MTEYGDPNAKRSEILEFAIDSDTGREVRAKAPNKLNINKITLSVSELLELTKEGILCLN